AGVLQEHAAAQGAAAASTPRARAGHWICPNVPRRGSCNSRFKLSPRVIQKRHLRRPTTLPRKQRCLLSGPPLRRRLSILAFRAAAQVSTTDQAAEVLPLSSQLRVVEVPGSAAFLSESPAAMPQIAPARRLPAARAGCRSRRSGPR